MPVVADDDFDQEGDRYTVVKVGMIGSGTVDIEGEKIDQETGINVGLAFDFPSGTFLHYGLSMEVMQMNWTAESESYQFDESELMLNIGLEFKGYLPLPAGPLVIRPGIGIGYGALRRLDRFNGTNYLTLRGFGELVYVRDRGPDFLFEGGLWYAPSGGDDETDIKIGPLIFLRAGVLF